MYNFRFVHVQFSLPKERSSAGNTSKQTLSGLKCVPEVIFRYKASFKKTLSVVEKLVRFYRVCSSGKWTLGDQKI
uniref:Uncharacterized protein n=1 Tax=Anguilla anguilla TaxID=7936 RepID=A0A0E9PYY3_ANGAN